MGLKVNFSVIVLAAGQGSRMGSTQPKVLQPLAGKPLLHHVLETVQKLAPSQTIVVCGYKGETLQESCKDFAVDWVWQNEQRGTGHAIQCAYPALSAPSRVLVLYGDVPLIELATLQQLLYATPNDSVGILTACVTNPSGLGRIIRNDKSDVIGIVEERDANDLHKQINEINTGIIVFPYQHLNSWLNNLKDDNEQKEFYLTDVIAMAVAERVSIMTQTVKDELEVAGVNSQLQLHLLERAYQRTIADKLMKQGVKIYDANRLDVRGNLTVASDVIIDVNVVFFGNVTIDSGVYIGPNVVIVNSHIAAGSIIYANSVIDGAMIGCNCAIGPFARIRPGTNLHAHTKIGNFVEIKNTSVDSYSKINHLSYVGDAIIGKRVNIGAGVVTCNYDGANKHTTVIEDDVFIGSNSELIAPVRVGNSATLAAGTTLTKDAPANALTLTKKIISNIINWQRPIKQKEEI